MAGLHETLHKTPGCNYGNWEDVEKILGVVVQRRKTIPTKCMEVNRRRHSLELHRLENAKVVTEENKEKENFRGIIQGFKKLRSFQFTLSDLREAENKLEKFHKRTKEISSYLEKRKKYIKLNF